MSYCRITKLQLNAGYLVSVFLFFLFVFIWFLLAVQWGEDGRPFHFLFYTGKQSYYSLMHVSISHLW